MQANFGPLEVTTALRKLFQMLTKLEELLMLFFIYSGPFTETLAQLRYMIQRRTSGVSVPPCVLTKEVLA